MNDSQLTEFNIMEGPDVQLGDITSSRSQSNSSSLTANSMSVVGYSEDQGLVSRSEESMISISNEDIIIAVMGPTGSGKSSFIHLATGLDQVVIGHDLRSCTHKVQAFRCPHPVDRDRSVVFIDTPGFDDTNTKDTDILQSIADWLTKTYRNGVTLTGLLFLHRITDNRMAGTPLRNLQMFERLCGVDALQNVMLVTTMWDDVQEKSVGISHEEELKAKYWNSMLNIGSRMLRFDYNRQSAWTIVDQFTGIRVRVPLQLQVELVDEGKDLSQTAAGSALYQWLDGLITQLRELLAKLVHRNARSPEEENVRRQLKQVKTQKTKLVDSECYENQDQAPNSTTGLESSQSRPIPWTGRTFTSEPISSMESTRGSKLATTISALRHAQGIANMTPFPPLRGAVGLCLTVAQSVEAMKRNEQALVSLAETAGRLIIGIAEATHSGNVPEDTQNMIRDLIVELEDLQKLVTRKGSRRGRVRRYILQSADAELVAACTERIHSACHLFEIKNAINTRNAIARIEAHVAAQRPPIPLPAPTFSGSQHGHRQNDQRQLKFRPRTH